MGATPVPVTDIASFAHELEAQGWDGLALGEAHGLLPDPYVALAAAASSTTRLHLGTAVSVPLRPPLLAAGAMVTLQALSHDRVTFTLGRGGGGAKIVPRWPITVEDFARYLEQLQQLLRRGRADVEGRSVSMTSMGTIDPSLELEKPRVDVAATGPRTLEAGTRWADGIVVSVGASDDALVRALDAARRAWRDAQRNEELAVSCVVQVAVTCGDDASAREAIRGLVMTHAGFAVPASRRRRIAREVVEASPSSGGEIDFYPDGDDVDALIDRFAIVGPAAHCAARLRQISELGFRRIYIGTRSVGVDLEERNTRNIGLDVLAKVR